MTQIKTERGEMRKRGFEWVRKRKRQLEERETKLESVEERAKEWQT